jgi:uncharacterized protein YjbI with pentapeptide repeats
MPEDAPTCQIHKKYGEIGCTNPALPNDPDGLCILHSQDNAKDSVAFREAILDIWNHEDSKPYNFRGVFFPTSFDLSFFQKREFMKVASFYRATFAEWAEFSGVTFNEWANFSHAIFGNKAIFHKATFNEGADFSWATFKDGGSFTNAIFIKKAVFSMAAFNGWTNFEAIFKDAVSFSQATFNDELYFIESTFTKSADFSMATFKKEAYFNECIFVGDAVLIFFKTKISGLVILWAINHPYDNGPQKSFNGEFQNLIFSPGGLLRFKDLYLKHSIFEWSDLWHVEFHNVQWHSYRGRQAIYDEILLRQDEKEAPCLKTWLFRYAPYCKPPSPLTDRYKEVERLYCNLKINYEDAGDYKNAGDFHYGEMEMHRRASPWRRWLSWYYFYWLLSGYGERPSRALGWLAGFLALFPLVIWLFGLDPSSQGQTPGFWETCTFMFEKATLQRPPLLSGINGFGRFISNLGLLFLPGQAALFLLALRNRLGRRR